FGENQDFGAFASALEEIASSVREAGEECEGNRSNMPDGLQDSETGQLLETRAEQCNTMADDLESAASEISTLGDDKEGDELNEALNEAVQLAEGVSFEYD